METAIKTNGHAAVSEAYKIIAKKKKEREQLFRRNSVILERDAIKGYPELCDSALDIKLQMYVRHY